MPVATLNNSGQLQWPVYCWVQQTCKPMQSS